MMEFKKMEIFPHLAKHTQRLKQTQNPCWLKMHFGRILVSPRTLTSELIQAAWLGNHTIQRKPYFWCLICNSVMQTFEARLCMPSLLTHSTISMIIDNGNSRPNMLGTFDIVRHSRNLPGISSSSAARRLGWEISKSPRPYLDSKFKTLTQLLWSLNL